ncbi:unnamed protein product [Durusdinium trenchii]|uniref:Protein of centriole 5 n=1 Tax=Durusdinium trenchii TaxID=1381693 RepID=A0ABP0SE11_9DINO
MGANVRPFSTTTTRRVASLLPTTISPRPKELGTSPRREDSTGRSAKRSAAGSVSPRHRDDALVLRAQFSVGDRVEYRSDTHRQWLPGTVQRIRENGTIYDLDVKKGAQASKLRRALDDPLDREVTARPFRAEPVTAVYRESKEPRRPRDLSTERRSPRDRRSEDPLERAMEKTEVQDGAVVGWAANAGREMASRAGAVTVRRMVQTTKLLLQNLETALMLRAGFLANCYHRWHLEVQFAKLDAHHREELEQHHDAWAAHFKNHQLSFEEELAKHARHQMTAKEKRQQQAMLIDAWAQWKLGGGQKQGLEAQLLPLVASSSSKRILGVSLENTAREMRDERVFGEVRQKEAELASAKGSFEKDKAAQDAAFMRKLQEIESKRRDNTSGVEAVLASWAKGKSKGSMALVWKHWITWSKDRARRDRRHEGIQLQLRRWAEGDRRGLVHGVWLRWRHEAQQRRTALQAQKAVESEAKKLEKLLDDERRRAAALEKQNAMSAEQRKEAAKRLMQYVAAKWEYGDKKGTLKGIMKGWCSYVLDAKRHSRRRQGVHDAVLKSLLGEARGSAKLALMNWHSLTKDEKRMRQMEDVERKANERLDNFMKDKDAEHEKMLQKAYNSVDAIKARAHHATQMVLRRWMGGDRKGILSQFFQDWQEYVKVKMHSAAQKQSVKDSVMRCYLGWMNYVKFELKHHRLAQQQQKKLEDLEMQMSKMQQKREHQMMRCAEAFAGKGSVLKGMVLRQWHEQSVGENAKMEAERERLVHLKELETQKQQAEELRKERIARALDGMGCRRTRVVLTEQPGVVLTERFFSGWAAVYDKAKLDQMYRLEHNEQMLKYSQFMLGQKFRKDAKALQAEVFSAWHIHGRFEAHEAHHETLQERLAHANSDIQQLEHHCADLQDELQMYYQQIRDITNTLQKELQTKEELASELRDAYEKLRTAKAPPGGDTGRSAGSEPRPRAPGAATPRSQRTPRDREPLGIRYQDGGTAATAPVSALGPNKREASAMSSASTAPTLPRRIPRGEAAGLQTSRAGVNFLIEGR